MQTLETALNSMFGGGRRRKATPKSKLVAVFADGQERAVSRSRGKFSVSIPGTSCTSIHDTLRSLTWDIEDNGGRVERR